jgi:hypothetical protein
MRSIDNDALNRRMAKYDKYEEKERNKDRDDLNPRRIPDEGGRVGRGRAQWMPEVAKDCTLPEDMDLSWAYEERPAEASDAGDLTAENDERHGSNGTSAYQDDVELDGWRGAATAPDGERLVGSDGTSPSQKDEGLEGVVMVAALENVMSKGGGKAQDFTNEPKFDGRQLSRNRRPKLNLRRILIALPDLTTWLVLSLQVADNRWWSGTKWDSRTSQVSGSKPGLTRSRIESGRSEFMRCSGRRPRWVGLEGMVGRLEGRTIDNPIGQRLAEARQINGILT